MKGEKSYGWGKGKSGSIKLWKLRTCLTETWPITFIFSTYDVFLIFLGNLDLYRILATKDMLILYTMYKTSSKILENVRMVYEKEG